MAANANPQARNGNSAIFSPSMAKAPTHTRRMLHTCMRQPGGWDPYNTQLQCLPDQSCCDARAHKKRGTLRDSRPKDTVRNQPTLTITKRFIHRLIQAPGSQHMTPLPTRDIHRSAKTELQTQQTATLRFSMEHPKDSLYSYASQGIG
ncbi:Hypothetical predicted protein [Pelobates cultripes]|uniref:Uncharacterized protein n=1 Tax=Pelobates cultripes TaxID=61616 RepID=A0AAD1QZL0_PELCU|nr:Hypothetical predicted protein [Pelobates cultripes]